MILFPIFSSFSQLKNRFISCTFLSFLILVLIFFSVTRSIVTAPLSMDPKSRVNGEKPFACNVCDHRFTGARSMRRHMQAVHDEGVFKCPEPGCLFSTSPQSNLTSHLQGFHATAKSFVCDHPGCTYRSPRRDSIAKHKQHVHSDERPFACNNAGCSYRTKTTANLSQHKYKVYMNIRDKRCHVREKGFLHTCHLRAHMTTHEGEGHEMAKCEDCTVNLRSKSSRKPHPAAGKLFLCDHQGCDYKNKWKSCLLSHLKQVHSEERPSSCSHTKCSFRCK